MCFFSDGLQIIYTQIKCFIKWKFIMDKKKDKQYYIQ